MLSELYISKQCFNLGVRGCGKGHHKPSGGVSEIQMLFFRVGRVFNVQSNRFGVEI